jgi:hypothetical protein
MGYYDCYFILQKTLYVTEVSEPIRSYKLISIYLCAFVGITIIHLYYFHVYSITAYKVPYEVLISLNIRLSVGGKSE